MIKTLLRKIFPIAFLKQCFLIYNKIKIRAEDKILYSEYKIQKKDFRVYREDYPFQINISSLQGRAVIFCKPMTHSIELWNSLVILPTTYAIHHWKIFLIRNKKRLRFIENGNEVEEICRRYGVEIIDADALSFNEQLEVFSQASFISGIHGAGLTNLVYRNNNCRIPEIFPPLE